MDFIIGLFLTNPEVLYNPTFTLNNVDISRV